MLVTEDKNQSNQSVNWTPFIWGIVVLILIGFVVWFVLPQLFRYGNYGY